MNLGGIGRGAPKNPQSADSPSDLIQPLANVASKAAKADKIKSVKLKIKVKGK